MPTVYKILGQAFPTNTSNTDLITVSSGHQEIISTLVVSNVTSTDATCRIFARIGGATAGTSNAIVYDVTVPGNGIQAFTLGITITATDVITVRSGTANALCFTAFGTEIS